MLFAEESLTPWLQAAQVIVTTAIGAWVAIRIRQIDADQRTLKQHAVEEKARCDKLERRVKALERRLKPPPKSRPKK